jgi:hypothetical protein
MNRYRPEYASSLVALLGCALLTVPAIGRAEAAALDARKLGATESAAEYCTRVVPDSKPQWREKVNLLIKGAPADAVDKARRSDEYRKAYDAETEFVGKVDERNAKFLCDPSKRARK